MTEGRELNCDEVRELLSPYLDRELTSDEMTDIARHLEDCPECMHKSTIFGQLSRVIKHWEGIKASEEVKRKLMEKVRRDSTRQKARKTLPLMLMLLLAGALLLGGCAALVVWLLSQNGNGGGSGERTAVAECVHKANRVEVITSGAPVPVKGRRKLYRGQTLLCNLGAAAQLRWPAEGAARAALVLRGPARLELVDSGIPRLEEQGTLVFHFEPTMSDGPGFSLKAGNWILVVPQEHRPIVGLVELRPGGGVRVAMLKGSVRLGTGGPSVKAGTEVTMDSGGTLGAPRKVTDKAAFDLLVQADSVGTGRE